MLKMSLFSIFYRSIYTSTPRLTRTRRFRKGNAGVAYQLREYEAGTEEALAQDSEGFGNLESDFMELHRTHRQHERELEQQRDKVRQQMIKHKYFREEQLPNLLTYAEKEQIRLLYARDPKEWSPEQLADNFPATPEVVRKILRAKWKPRSAKRIQKHDEAVMKNWQRLRSSSSEIQLSAELKDHLQKFANRERGDIKLSPASWQPLHEIPRPQQQEFLSLITSCKKYAENDCKREQETGLLEAKSNDIMPEHITDVDAESESYLRDKVLDKRQMRIRELKALKLTAEDLDTASSGTQHQVSVSLEQRTIEMFGNPSGTGIIPSTKTDISHLTTLNFAERFQSKEIVISAEDCKRFDITSIKERIHIPRKVWREGATYRVEDCYYDSDGEFLYRVPGMRGRSTNN